MNIDIESIKQAISAFGTALTVLKQAKDLLPDNSKKKELSSAIESVERELKLAESKTAHALGYELCRNHFPPEIMLSDNDANWNCPICNSQKHTGAEWGTLPGW